MATWIERFFAEDAAMRLYNAAEHLANAVAMLRGLNSQTLSSERARSQWQRVRRVLQKQAVEDPICIAMCELGDTPHWQFVIRYRGQVVHDQPPILQGLGVSYRRRHRWTMGQDGTRRLVMSSTGDEAEYSPEQVMRMALMAAAGLLTILTVVVDQYFGLLARHGIKETPTGLQFNPFHLGTNPIA